MDKSLREAAATLNGIKRRALFWERVVTVARCFILATLLSSLWAIVSPGEELEQLALGLVSLLALLWASIGKKAPRTIGPPDVALWLEMHYGRQQSQSLTSFDDSAPLPTSWQQAVGDHRHEMRRCLSRRNLSMASTLIVPLLVAAFTLPSAAPTFALALHEVKDVVARLNRDATLKVLQGATQDEPEKGHSLAAKEPVQLELLAQNLVEITVTGGFGKETPVVELRRTVTADPFAEPASTTPATSSSVGEKPDSARSATPADEEFDSIELSENTLTPSPASSEAAASGPEPASKASAALPSSPPTAPSGAAPAPEAKTRSGAPHERTRVFQSFQMSPIRSTQRDSSPQESGSWSISFAVAEPVDLYIPALAGERPLAHLKVRQLPLPKVRLVQLSDAEDPWPDDQPLALRIQVRSENPLQLVRLLIKSGQRVSKELVANVMTEDKTELDTDYQLLLEPYVESDMARVEIVAEAIDRSLPAPLVGVSNVLQLNTASAYGRYRHALQTLREVKRAVDDAIEKEGAPITKETRDLAQKASAQSERSPFFDGLDRVMIKRFEDRVAALAERANDEDLLELNQQLNDFLFEHEILDDRERDRDFFVAARGLSRVLEQQPEKRPLPVGTVVERLERFLDDRYARWEKRIARLDQDLVPPSWPHIATAKPFHGAMEQIAKLNDQAAKDARMRGEQLAALSQAVVDYRTFIEDLEAREDKMREKQEKERQEGLASARNVLRELQQRQGEISAALDRANQRSAGELSEAWPGTRMKQNTNVRETSRLEGQMRSLSPSAAQRIQAAMEAMEKTSEAGESANFVLAESGSDLAGRMLRQAERAAQQSQQKRRDRGRRRRVTGDNYYGQSVVGGDVEIKREYEVDRRYREDILDEVEHSNLDEEQQGLLESYLRQVIR